MIALPRGPMSQYRVQGDQQLVHAGGQGNLLRLACGQETFVKYPDYGIAAGGYESTHIECGPNVGSAAPHAAFPSPPPAVPVEGCHPHQGGELLVIQRPQFGQISQQGPDQDGPDPWGIQEQVFLLLPDRTSRILLARSSLIAAN